MNLNINKFVVFLLSITLLTLFFSNTLSEFLFSDDTQNYMMLNSLAYKHPNASAWEAAYHETKNWMSQGRFTPLTFLWQDTIFFYMPSILFYRWFVLLMNFIGIGIFLCYLYHLNAKISLPIWVVCLCAVMQFRIQYHDVYTSLHGMYQFLATLVFLCLIFYIKFVKKPHRSYVLISSLLYAAALLQSEVGLIALFLLPATGLYLRVPVTKLFKQLLPYIAITFIYMSYLAWLKMNIVEKHTIYKGLQPNIDLLEMLDLFKRQMYACLPFSNLHKQIAIPQVIYHRFTTVPFASIALVVNIVLLFWLFFKKKMKQTAMFDIRVVLLSILLITVPALFILPSLKYQREMPLGAGYLPIYFQNLGTATLLACVLKYLLDRKHLLGYCLSAIVALAVVVTYLFNTALVNASAYEYSSRTIAQYKSIKQGIMNEVLPGSTVLIGHFWKTADLHHVVFSNLYGKELHVLNEEDYVPSTTDSLKNCYLLESLPAASIRTILFEVDCTNGERRKILKEKTHQNTFNQTELEKTILHRIYK